MKKCILVFILMSSFCIIANSQVQLVIEEVNLSNIQPSFSEDIIDEGNTEGPYIYMKCCISNLTDHDTTLYPSKSRLSIKFIFGGNDYTIEIYPLKFLDNDSLLLREGCKESFYVGSHLLLGTPIWNEDIIDYSMIMLELLPTLQIQYNEPQIKLSSRGILKVNLKH